MVFREHLKNTLSPLRTLFDSSQRTLRTHLFLFAAALIGPLLFLVAIALFSNVSADLEKARSQLVRTAEDISQDVDREISAYLTVLKTLSTSTILERGNYADFHARARAALEDRPAHVLVLDPSLQQLVNTRVPYGTDLPKTADKRSAQIVLESREPYISNVFFGTISGRKVINIEYPVIKNDAVKYILLITIDIDEFADIISRAKAAEGFVISLSDRDGRIISTVPKDATRPLIPISELAKVIFLPEILEYEDKDGEQWIAASVKSGLSGWRTTVSASKVILDKVLWMSVRWFSFAAVAAALLTVFLGTMLGKRLAASIKEVRRATVCLAQGQEIPQMQLSMVEANDVLKSLNRTSELIATRTDKLRESEERSREQVQQIDTLMNELAHRNKNQLSIILAMARQLAGTSKDLDEFLEKFSQRISAKAIAQDLVTQGATSGVSLSVLLENQVKSFTGEKSSRIEASGPEVFLTGEAARTIGMAFHELATNATKYGALNSPDGQIRVNWSVSRPDGLLKIEWREEGGPKVREPERFGFGHKMVDTYVAQTIKANVTYNFKPSGIEWIMEAGNLLVSDGIENERSAAE